MPDSALWPNRGTRFLPVHHNWLIAAVGTWIRDIARSSGSATHELYGTDINGTGFPADPPSGTVYMEQDINQPWPEDWLDRFDLVHQRLVLVGGGTKQKEAVESLGKLVKPGGWIQLIEGVNELPDGCGPAMHDFITTMEGVFTFMGFSLTFSEKIPGWLKSAGFVDIRERIVSTKLGAQNPEPTLARMGVFATSGAARGLATYGKSIYSPCIGI